jgi:hypothetical protein
MEAPCSPLTSDVPALSTPTARLNHATVLRRGHGTSGGGGGGTPRRQRLGGPGLRAHGRGSGGGRQRAGRHTLGARGCGRAGRGAEGALPKHGGSGACRPARRRFDRCPHPAARTCRGVLPVHTEPFAALTKHRLRTLATVLAVGVAGHFFSIVFFLIGGVAGAGVDERVPHERLHPDPHHWWRGPRLERRRRRRQRAALPQERQPQDQGLDSRAGDFLCALPPLAPTHSCPDRGLG